MQQGKASIRFEHPPGILSAASIAGKKEGEGPLAILFDEIVSDPLAGEKTWEEAESQFQKKSAQKAIEKAGLSPNHIRYVLAGDLLGQSIASTFGVMDWNIPFFGLYGACSTMGETLSLGAMLVNAGYGDHVLCVTSSHFASAEKQFRFPLHYGNQRPYSATWTVTGSGAVILSSEGKTVKITGVTTGKIVDFGLKDSMNMGACMAPAAADCIGQNFQDFGVDAGYYDRIITGDLGSVGKKALIDLMAQKGFDLQKTHMDCGIEIYNSEAQDTHAGGSGCGCAALVLCAYIVRMLEEGRWRRVLFVPTGALLSPTSFNEGQSIPGIAHAVILENMEGETNEWSM